MIQKPLPASAVISLASGALGWLAALPLLLFDYQRMMGATAGVGLVVPFLTGVVSATLCVSGIVSGVIALAVIGKGDRRGRVISRAGIIVSAVPLAVFASAAGYLLGWW